MSNADVSPVLLDVSTAARALGISRSQLYKLFDEGSITRVHIGARALVHVSEVERFAASLLPTAR
jgi:excisionase family DNA binding protein